MPGAFSVLSLESFRCSVGLSESSEEAVVLDESPLEPDPELLSLASRRCRVGLSGSLGGVLDPLLPLACVLPVVLLPVLLVVLLEPEPEPLSLPSFLCSVGLSESVVDPLLPASFTTCGGCFDIGGFAFTLITSGLTDPIAIHEPSRFCAPLTLKSPLGLP